VPFLSRRPPRTAARAGGSVEPLTSPGQGIISRFLVNV
jgi:hypothetical protein